MHQSADVLLHSVT